MHMLQKEESKSNAEGTFLVINRRSKSRMDALGFRSRLVNVPGAWYNSNCVVVVVIPIFPRPFLIKERKTLSRCHPV